MKKLTLVCTMLGALGVSNSAQAAQGFYDSYGYQVPSKYRPAPPAAPKPTLFGFKPAKKKLLQAQKESDYEPVEAPKKKKRISDGEGQLAGGSRPSVAPMAPQKARVSTGYGAGQIVIDQSAKKLYYTLSSTQAYVYPVAVGKQGFKWTGTQKISREVDWPDWKPPAEMRERKPNLPEHMAGGIRNPLGAKALYLGNSLYRIHGTNDPKSIGTDASSGCIRMFNGHVVHLASVAGVGTTVHVVSRLSKKVAAAD